MGEKRSLRVGVVNYLNAYPLWAALEFHSSEHRTAGSAASFHSDKSGANAPAAVKFHSQVELVHGVPSFLANELQSGHLDAALVSSVEYLRHSAGFVYHPSLCIAATRESKSIRLFLPDATQPFAAAIMKLHTIFTDVSSRSSVAQLRVILGQLGAAPKLEEVSNAGERIAALHAGEALLTIGDTALAHMNEPSYDVQQQYFEIFQHGFVYALWVMREDQRNALEPILASAHAIYNEDISKYLRLAAERFGFSTDFTEKYLTETIQHVLSPERQADLQFFAEKLKNL